MSFMLSVENKPIVLIVFMLNVMAPFAYAGSSTIAMPQQLMPIACQEFVF